MSAARRLGPLACTLLVRLVPVIVLVAFAAACSTASTTGPTSATAADGSVVGPPIDRPLVAASTPLVAALVRSIAGDEVRVQQLSDPGDDPGAIAVADPAAALGDTDLVVVIDDETHEVGLDTYVSAARTASTPVLALAPQLGPIPVGGSQLDPRAGDTGGATDPRVWLDPDRWTQAGRLVADAVTELDGVDAAVIATNLAAFDEALSRADERLQATFATIPTDHRALVSDLSSLAYLTDRYGFDLHLASGSGPLAAAATDRGATGVLTAPTRAEELTAELAQISPLLIVTVDLDGAAIAGVEPGATGATGTYLQVLESAATAITTAATTT